MLDLAEVVVTLEALLELFAHTCDAKRLSRALSAMKKVALDSLQNAAGVALDNGRMALAKQLHQALSQIDGNLREGTLSAIMRTLKFLNPDFGKVGDDEIVACGQLWLQANIKVGQ